MEIIFKNYTFYNNIINFSIQDKQINGITGTDKEKLIDVINLKFNYKGKIIINTEELNKENIKQYKQKIGIIHEKLELPFFLNTTYELFQQEIKRKELIIKAPEKKIKDSLKIVGLSTSLLNRNINSLSTSERKLIQIALCLLSNPNLIIMEEPFKFLDIKKEKKIMLVLHKIKDLYNKTIIFISNDSDMLYKYTDHLIIIKNKKILIEGNTYEIYQKIDYLKKNKIEIPKLAEFTYLVKKNKQVKIDYHKDVRDIIKDIYKHI